MWLKEIVNPFDATDKDFWIKVEHIGRYIYAADVIKQRLNCSAVVSDMGCAVGYGTRLLSPVARKVYGFDFSNDYLEEAKRDNTMQNTEYNFIDLQAESPAGLDGKFDAIVSFEVLEHIDDASTALTIFSKALVRGGLLICSVPNEKYEAKDEYGKPSNIYHKRIYSRDEIIKKIEEAGFEIEEVLGQYLPNVMAKKESKMMRKRKEPMLTATHPIFRESKFVEFFGGLMGYPTSDNIEQSYSYIYLAHKK